MNMPNLDSIIEKAIRNHESDVKLLTHTTDYDVYMSVRNVMRNNPDIFWFSHQWCYSQEKATVSLRYTIDKERCEKIARQIDDVVRNDFKLDYVRTLSVREQMMYVYKWLALYCNYDTHSAHNQTIYSVFVYRNSVCTGIAKAAQYLFKLLGIESRLVFGKMNNSEKDSRHCWLIVNIKGRWYHIDPTFAIPETEHLLQQCGVKQIQGDDILFYNFFCVDTATIKQSRTIEEEKLLPLCNYGIDYTLLQQIKVTPSRNGETAGLGCLLSDVGTTADIYLAHSADKHERHRTVAKVFKNDSDHELLRKELIVMRECAGSHLLRAQDADFDEGILYMEQATPLSELLVSHYYKLTLKEFCNLLVDIASGLQELSDHGIIYRDIHLNNIYISTDSDNGKITYKLGDFGSCTFADDSGKYAGLTERGGVGSKWYMSPETWNECKFDECSSVYGIGMIAYYLLNDLYPPFWQEYGEESLDTRMRSHRLPIPSKLQEEGFFQLRMDFILKSLNKNPSKRYQTLSELIDAIKECKSVNPDRLLIKGSEFKMATKKLATNVFCSTCIVNPSVTVSNGELGDAVVDDDGDFNADFLFVDNNEDGQIGSFDVVDTSSQINDFATTCGGSWNDYNEVSSDIDASDFAIPSRQRIEDFATTCAPCPHNISREDNRQKSNSSETYLPCGNNNQSRTQKDEKVCASPAPQSSKSLFGKIKNLIFGKTDKHISSAVNDRIPIAQKVNSSIFAPSEARRGDYMMVQVFLYQDGEEKTVSRKASEVDSTAQRRNYTPLNVMLKHGDIVKVMLAVTGTGVEIEEPAQELIWNGNYTDCQFGVFVTERFKASTLLSTVKVSVNGVQRGRMMFKTTIVNQPRKLYAEIHCKTFNKIFISYSHKDEQRVKYIAEAYRAQGVDYFFDRHYLKGGDIYPVKIKEYIDSADLFILCWSKNAAESNYVSLELKQALALAYPQVDMEKATIAIHPISIEPRAEYPMDMKEVYNFEEV